MEVPITQSREWQQLQDALGERSFLVTGKGYHFLAILKITGAGNYLYCPYGPVAKDVTALKDSLSKLRTLAKEHHAIFIEIEPMAEFKHSQFLSIGKALDLQVKKVKDVSPKDTWILNLTPSEETLIQNFSQGTRTRFHNYHNKGLIVEKSTNSKDLSALVELQKQLFVKKKIQPYDPNYLAKELEQQFASLYLVRYVASKDTTRLSTSEQAKETTSKVIYPADGQILAASLFFDYNDTRYYMQSAADVKYRRLPATVALLTKAIFDAKNAGITQFDFWGIAPENAPPDHPWSGFTEFKKSFGGSPRHYSGTYDFILTPTRYTLFQLARKTKKKATKLLRKSRSNSHATTDRTIEKTPS